MSTKAVVPSNSISTFGVIERTLIRDASISLLLEIINSQNALDLSAKIALYQRAPINCTPLKPLPLNQASQNAINANTRPSPAAAPKA
jgi:hypothetical protein